MGHLLKIKCVDSRVNVHILASTSVPFTLTTVQVPNLALTHMKGITVCIDIKYGKLTYTRTKKETVPLVSLCSTCQREKV